MPLYKNRGSRGRGGSSKPLVRAVGDTSRTEGEDSLQTSVSVVEDSEPTEEQEPAKRKRSRITITPLRRTSSEREDSVIKEPEPTTGSSKKKKKTLPVTSTPNPSPVVPLRLKNRSEIIDDDSDDDDNGSYEGGRIGISSQSLGLSVSLLKNDHSVESESTTMSNSNRSLRSEADSTRNGYSDKFRSSLSATIVNEKEKYDNNDPDWIKFSEYVKQYPASAHEKLSSDLLDAGAESATKCSALLGKLICRSLAEEEESAQDANFYKKCTIAIMQSVLHLTIRNDNSTDVIVDLVNMMLSQLCHFSTVTLYTVVESCINYMKEDKDREGYLPPRWIELFGKIVSILNSKGGIEHESDIINGEEYREYVVNGICRLKWTTDNTASLIAVLREIPDLNQSDLNQILLQLRSCMKDIKASAFPPIVHQLILLAKDKSPLNLLLLAADYFNANDAGTPIEVRQKRNALGTVVYHFLEAAGQCEPLVKAVIKIVKASFFDFGEVLSPFMLSIVLGFTNIEYAFESIVEPLRIAIVQHFHVMHLTEQSCWYKQTAGCSQDTVTECFKTILETVRSADLEYMFKGLRELGFKLLNAEPYQKQYPNTLERCQNLGAYLIRSLVKCSDSQISIVMKHWLKETNSKSAAHTECLSNCMDLKTRHLLHPSNIGVACEIIQQLPMINSDPAALIVKGMSVALQMNYMLLDQLMIILRKTIWRSVEARRTAARIMIILLSNSKVIGDIPCSQYSESQRFLDSQSQVPNSQRLEPLNVDNKPMCVEILNLTQRCFAQQCEIRKELCLGFHTVVRRNPGICEMICSQLYKHSVQYLSGEDSAHDDGDEEAMMELKKVVELPPNDIFNSVIIKEELGFTVQCLSHVARKSHEVFEAISEDEPPAVVDDIEKLMKRWTNAVLTLTPEKIELAAADTVAGAGGGSRPLETVHYVETIFTFQVLQIIEALIEFISYDRSQDCNSIIIKRLFEKFKLLEPLLQKKKDNPSSKKGKGDKSKPETSKGKKGKGNVNDDVSVCDTASEVSASSGGKFKRPDAPKKLIYFHIFNLESVHNMLRKIYGTDADRVPLQSVHRSDSDFEKMLLATVSQKLTSFKRKEPLHERQQRQERVIEMLTNIAGTIWNGLCNQDHENIDEIAPAKSEIIEMRLQTINDIVEHLCSFHASSCCPLIKQFGDEINETSYDEAFTKFFNSWKTLQEWLPANPEGEEDRNFHKLLFDILRCFSKPMSPDTRENSNAGPVLSWLWNYMSIGKGNQVADFELADSVISCWLAYYLKARGFLEQPGMSQHDLLSLSKTIRAILTENKYMIDSQFCPPHEDMWIINEETAGRAIINILDFIEIILSHIMTLIKKLKSQPSGQETSEKHAVSIRERCFNMMDQILGVCDNLISSAFPAGACTTAILKVIPQIFTVMTQFGEYLFEVAKTKPDYSLIKGFMRPVNRIGNSFRSLVDNMIQQAEFVQREHAIDVAKNANTGGSKKKVTLPNAVKNKVVQDARMIPNVVYVVEKYENQMFTLANKLKKHKGQNLLVGMRLPSARDIKIDGNKFAQALKENRPRSVQEMTSVLDDDTIQANANPRTPVPGPSRVRKGRKRKTSEEAEANHQE